MIMEINIIILIIGIAIILYLTTPWKNYSIVKKNDHKEEIDPKSSEYFDQRDIEAKKIQEDLKAKSESAKDSEIIEDLNSSELKRDKEKEVLKKYDKN